MPTETPQIDNLLTRDDEHVLEALRTAQQLRMLQELQLPIRALGDALAIEELRSYNRSWNHPLGLAVKS